MISDFAHTVAHVMRPRPTTSSISSSLWVFGHFLGTSHSLFWGLFHLYFLLGAWSTLIRATKLIWSIASFIIVWSIMIFRTVWLFLMRLSIILLASFLSSSLLCGGLNSNERLQFPLLLDCTFLICIILSLTLVIRSMLGNLPLTITLNHLWGS